MTLWILRAKNLFLVAQPGGFHFILVCQGCFNCAHLKIHTSCPSTSQLLFWNIFWKFFERYYGNHPIFCYETGTSAPILKGQGAIPRHFTALRRSWNYLLCCYNMQGKLCLRFPPFQRSGGQCRGPAPPFRRPWIYWWHWQVKCSNAGEVFPLWQSWLTEYWRHVRITTVGITIEKEFEVTKNNDIITLL